MKKFLRVLVRGVFDNASKKAQWLVSINHHISSRFTFTEGVCEESQFLRAGHGRELRAGRAQASSSFIWKSSTAIHA